MNETAELVGSLEYVLSNLEADIKEQQQHVDEWLERVEFYDGEDWEAEADLCRNILRQCMERLAFLKETREKVERAIRLLAAG